MDRLESRHYLWCSTESCREHSLSRAPAAGSAEKDAAIILSVRLKGQDLQEMTLRTSQKSQARISTLSKSHVQNFCSDLYNSGKNQALKPALNGRFCAEEKLGGLPEPDT